MTIETTRIPHDGGENPVREGETLKKMWLRGGQELTANDDGSVMRWSHEGNAGDIIAYAVTPERKHEVLRTPDDDRFSAYALKDAERMGFPMYKAPAEPRETLRDRVAMAALTGLLADGSYHGYVKEVVVQAHRIADAFMAARGDV